MNGARSYHSGSLVNSADVSDQATGATAINIPIDVVSSVQVFSTPYNPEYGRFTGAVSDVETRPGDFNKFHTSVQHLLPRFRRLNGSIMGHHWLLCAPPLGDVHAQPASRSRLEHRPGLAPGEDRRFPKGHERGC